MELSCGFAQKMEILRRIAGMPQILDLAIVEPTLDEIYASFLSAKGRPN
jgi:hypothetical protein